MSEYFNIKCPHCGSTELRSNDLIGATCDITGWSVHNGNLVPEWCGESQVHWDSQGSADKSNPYECGNCMKPLSETQLAATLTKKLQKTIELPAVPKAIEPAKTFHLFYIEANDSDGTHAYMVSRGGDETAAKAEAEKDVLDLMGIDHGVGASIEHCRRISGCDTQFFEVVGVLAAN